MLGGGRDRPAEPIYPLGPAAERIAAAEAAHAGPGPIGIQRPRGRTICTAATGASVHPHRHANDEVWHILDGDVEATVGGQVRRLRAGQAAVVPPDVEHSVRAVTDSRAIVVDSPTRDVVGGVDIG